MKQNTKFMIVCISATMLLCIICFVVSEIIISNNKTDMVNAGNAEQGMDFTDATIYQILVYSYADSDGDGTGDFKGISEHLDYLKDLGINAIWLSPINEAMSYHGYDVVDYYSINSDYVVDDYTFENLILDCKEKGIGIIMDLVIHHTSSECEWFTEGIKAYKNGTDNKYKLFYNFSNNNFKFSSGKYVTHELDGIYYQSYFSPYMPDLNYSSADAMNEIVNVAEYWLNQGVVGFRLDAINHLYSDSKTPVQLVGEFYSRVKEKYPNVYMVGESWDDSSNDYYDSGINAVFSFGERTKITQSLKGFTGYEIWLESNQKEIRSHSSTGREAYFISNHDLQRVSELINPELYRPAAAMLILSPGNSFIYYGEEIGLQGTRVLSKDYIENSIEIDKNVNPYDDYKDASYRTPMYWNKDTNLDASYIIDSTAGNVSKCKSVVDDIEPAEEQYENQKSLYNYYRKLIALKNKYSEIYTGEVFSITTNCQRVIAYAIKGEERGYVIVHNISNGSTKMEFESSDYILEDDSCVSTDGEKVKLNGNVLTMPAYSSVILVTLNREQAVNTYINITDVNDKYYILNSSNNNKVSDENMLNEVDDGILMGTASVLEGDKISISNVVNSFGKSYVKEGGSSEDFYTMALNVDVSDVETYMVVKNKGTYTFLFNIYSGIIMVYKEGEYNDKILDNFKKISNGTSKYYFTGEFCDWKSENKYLLKYDVKENAYIYNFTTSKNVKVKIRSGTQWFGYGNLQSEYRDKFNVDMSFGDIVLPPGTYKIKFIESSKSLIIE